MVKARVIFFQRHILSGIYSLFREINENFFNHYVGPVVWTVTLEEPSQSPAN